MLEAVAELRSIAKGNLLSPGIGHVVKFECDCGRINQRGTQHLKQDQVVRCVGPTCNESYAVELKPTVEFRRRVYQILCPCGVTELVPALEAKRLGREDVKSIQCKECGLTPPGTAPPNQDDRA